MDFGQFTRQHYLAFAQRLSDVLQCVQNPMRRLIENQRRLKRLQFREKLPALSLLRWQKSVKQERISRQSGSAERRDQRAWAGQWRNSDSLFASVLH